MKHRHEILIMSNKEKMLSALELIESFGFHILDIQMGDTYFLYEDESDSICHFHIKEIPGFLFAFWNTCRYDSIYKQILENGIGYTWADSLGVDPKSELIFFTQYERDLDKFKPSRSGFVHGIYRDSWEEENDAGEIVTVEKWRNEYDLEKILNYMKKHRIRCVNYVGSMSKYIWDDDRSGIKLFFEFTSDWIYTYKSRFKKYLKYKYLIMQAKQLIKSLNCSYGVLIDEGDCWSPRLKIILRRKYGYVDLRDYSIEQQRIDEFEDKYFMEIGVTQFDIDITEKNISREDMQLDDEENRNFYFYVTNIGKEEDDGRKIIFSNVKGL